MEHSNEIATTIKTQIETVFNGSNRAASAAAGIPQTTFNRKLANGGGDFTVLELKKIADALGSPFMDLVKT